jgi:hypothetical protein
LEVEMRILTLLLFFVFTFLAQAEEALTFENAKIADEESIARTKAFLESVYRQHYRNYEMEGEIEIEIINPPNEPLFQRWEEDDSGDKSLYVYWMYHVWYNNIHMDCYQVGQPTLKSIMCPYRQEIDPDGMETGKAQASK